MVEEGLPKIAEFMKNESGSHLEVADGTPVEVTTTDGKRLLVFWHVAVGGRITRWMFQIMVRRRYWHGRFPLHRRVLAGPVRRLEPSLRRIGAGVVNAGGLRPRLSDSGDDDDSGKTQACIDLWWRL